MSSTLAHHIPLSLLDRWEIDAQIEQDFKTRTNPVQATKFTHPPKPRPETKPEVAEDDGFTVVKKGYKKRTDYTSHAEIKLSHAFTALPSGKPSIPQGTGKAHKKNMKRKVKKTKAS